ncbi:MAG: Mammalian cell entry related domain protein [Verrucomicrobia bacterium]|nr:Mammalian cell entry related domain protein [Verrucomicrobiota bacterium]
MNNLQQTARVGLFFLLGLALTWVTFETLSGGKLFKNKGYTLIAGFESLKELKDGDEVRMAGVKIGVVEKTRLAGRRAEAVLRIDPGTKIANDATASIVMAGLIGTNYIGIDLGSEGSPPLADGAEIKTKVTPDINTIMTEIGNLGQKLEGALSSFGTTINGDGKGGGLFQKLDKLVTENSEKVGATMTNLQEITTKLNKGEGTIGRLINDPTLHDQLVAAVSEIQATAAQAKTFVADAQGIIAQVKSGKGALGTLVYDETAADNLRSTVANLRSVSDKLAKGEGTLGKLINDDTLYISAQSTIKKADRALDGLGDSGPITAVGIVANSLF